MDVRDLVRDHYGSAGLGQAVLDALSAAGVDTSELTAEDLYPVDQLHAGGRVATEYLLDQLDLTADIRLLDVGSGLGGVARLAAMRGAAVTGVDLTPEFVEAATQLTERCGLSDRVEFLTTSADALGFEDDSFDRAVMVHVGMNISDKEATFAQVRRVLVPGGRFGLYEQMSTGTGEPIYPLPWAVTSQTSFVATLEDYVRNLEAAGFTVDRIEDRTETLFAPRPPARVGPGDVLGEAYVEQAGNYVASVRAGVFRAVLLVATAH